MPRRVVPGQTVLLTRRTIRRHHLFRPDDEMNQLFLYCLAVSADKWGIEVHVPVVMSSHFHIVLTDVRGELPHFMRDFHRLLALGTKVLRRWEGSVFARVQTSVVELKTPEAVVEKMGYGIVNSVSAGLVRRPQQWPGVHLTPNELGTKVWVVERPKFFFNERNRLWPDSVTLRSTVPPALLQQGCTPQQARTDLVHEVRRQVIEARAELRQKGRRPRGAKAVLRGSPYARATSFEPKRGRNPQFAVGRGQRGAFLRAARELRAFRQAYREALQHWRRGLRNACFPKGTWWMRVFCCVDTEPIGLSWLP